MTDSRPQVIEVHQAWYCPACRLTKETKGPFRPNLLHTCPKTGGLDFPLVRAGVKAKVEAVVRQDHVGDDIVRTDDRGRPIMSVVTTRDNGQDLHLFIPGARAQASAFPQFGNSRQRPVRMAEFLRRRAMARAPLATGRPR